MTRVAVGFGANLGNPIRCYEQVLGLLPIGTDFTDIHASKLITTKPVGGPADQPDYCNGAIVFESSLSPHEILRVLLSIENKLGRQRGEHWSARTCDLDLLLVGDAMVGDAVLTLPHPRLHYRRFVLEPLSQIAADWVHPATGFTLGELRKSLDSSATSIIVVGANREEFAEVSEELMEHYPGRLVVDCPRDSDSIGMIAVGSSILAAEVRRPFAGINGDDLLLVVRSWDGPIREIKSSIERGAKKFLPAGDARFLGIGHFSAGLAEPTSID